VLSDFCFRAPYKYSATTTTTIKLTNPCDEYQVGGRCQNYTEAASEDISPRSADAPKSPSSADTAYSSLSAPVHKH